MVLIADSGSTKTNWCLIRSKDRLQYFDTEGYNPYFVSPDYITRSLEKSLPVDIAKESVNDIFFYGAGCFDNKTNVIENALRPLFSCARISAGLDLLGSAVSVLGKRAGLVAILGTGTNTCLYDGTAITSNIDSLGYLLGDEGSGYYLGKKLLGDYVRKYMPAAVSQEFFEHYRLTREEIMEHLYAKPLPNRFCAGFTLFLKESESDTAYTHGLVKHAFRDFFESLITRYENYSQYTFNCTGSVGYAFKESLAETAAEYHMKLGTIVKEPIGGLVQFHMPGKIT